MSAAETGAALAAALETMAEAADRLLDTTSRVQGCLVSGDVEQLLSALAEQEQAVSEVLRLEDRRRELVERLADALDRPASERTAAGLTAALARTGDADAARRLAAAARLVAERLGRIGELNDRNRMLAGQGLAATQAVLRTLDGSAEGYPAGRTGRRLPLRIDRLA